MTTFINFILMIILPVVFFGGLFLMSSKFQDLQSIAKEKRNEKIKPMLDVNGVPLHKCKEDFYRAEAEYDRDSKTIDYLGVAMLIMFIFLFVLFTGGFKY